MHTGLPEAVTMKIDVCAGILAGGKSSRMGTNKALLPFGDSTFLEGLLNTCAVFPEVLLSVDRPEPYRHLAVTLVPDEQEGFGPVEGIYQMLRAARSPYVLVMAADMPLLSAPFLLAAAGALRGDEDCLALRMGGSLEPLCSIYGKGALPALAGLRREGCRRPRALFDRVNTRYLDGESLGYDARLVRNVNTPEEYEALRRDSRPGKPALP